MASPKGGIGFPAIVLIAVGLFWLALVASGEGILGLLFPGFFSIGSGLASLQMQNDAVKILVKGSLLYDLALTLYHAIASLTLFKLGLTTLAALALLGYSALSVILALTLILALFPRASP